MTALAFIIGVIPLVVATGAGAGARTSIGTTVFGGMVLASFVGVLFVPTLFVGFERMREATVAANSSSKPVSGGVGAVELPVCILQIRYNDGSRSRLRSSGAASSSCLQPHNPCQWDLIAHYDESPGLRIGDARGVTRGGAQSSLNGVAPHQKIYPKAGIADTIPACDPDGRDQLL